MQLKSFQKVFLVVIHNPCVEILSFSAFNELINSAKLELMVSWTINIRTHYVFHRNCAIIRANLYPATPQSISKSIFISVCTTNSPILPRAFNIPKNVIILGKRRPCTSISQKHGILILIILSIGSKHGSPLYHISNQ